jgi:hypothetical protein
MSARQANTPEEEVMVSDILRAARGGKPKTTPVHPPIPNLSRYILTAHDKEGVERRARAIVESGGRLEANDPDVG